MKLQTFSYATILLLVIAGILAPRAEAQNIEPDIIIEVDGLACPFCTFGIEKKLKKIEGVDELVVYLEDGKIEMSLKEGATVSEEQIERAIAEAGFEARSITFVNENAKAPNGSDTSR